MTDHLDPSLQAVFADARQELVDEAFTHRVMAKTRRLKFLALAIVASAIFLLLTIAWFLFAMPLLEFALLIVQAFGTTLVDLGEGWLALVFLPVNNVASLGVITLKAIHLFRKKIRGASLFV
jgi:small-conductance mechanosensitive channel